MGYPGDLDELAFLQGLRRGLAQMDLAGDRGLMMIAELRVTESRLRAAADEARAAIEDIMRLMERAARRQRVQ